jgi:hypothetical protein
MNCAIPNCLGELRISHTYPVASEKFQRATCQVCGTIHALATQATIVTARGDGARAQASRARQICNEGPPSAPH